VDGFPFDTSTHKNIGGGMLVRFKMFDGHSGLNGLPAQEYCISRALVSLKDIKAILESQEVQVLVLVHFCPNAEDPLTVLTQTALVKWTSPNEGLIE
jgi:hypothetical protein